MGLGAEQAEVPAHQIGGYAEGVQKRTLDSFANSSKRRRLLTPRKASDVFVECLEAEGVERVFGIPGEETLDLNESLADSSIEFVPVRHEQGGAYMANVYGRLTGHAGVCLGTLGPGATNLVTAVADAYLDREIGR